MKKREIIVLTGLLLMATTLTAQTRKISGRVIADNGTAVANAMVILRTVQDSLLVRGTMTDERGIFVLDNVSTGTYWLHVLHASFQSSRQKVTTHNNDIALKDISISKIKAADLKEIEIKSQRPFLVRSVDKITLNVEGSVYEKGENALKLFNIIPGVQVTGNDIKFRGSENVTVYVDNRKILLPGEQLFAYLRFIPSESILSYELKAVPGAETDAQNRGVIINIVLKSAYKYGLSGNISSGYWYNDYHNFMGSTLINYNTGKLTIQGGFNYRRAPAFYEDNIVQQFTSSGVYSPQTEKYYEDYNLFSCNTGFDYKLTNRQTFGANYNVFTNPGDINNITTTDIRFLTNPSATATDSSLHTGKRSRFRYSNNMANVFYRNRLDSLGSKLDAGYSYIYYDLNDPSTIASRFLNHGGEEFHPRDTLFTNNSGQSNIHVLNIDLEKHFSNQFVLTAGSKYTVSKTDYEMDYRHSSAGHSPLDTLQTNRFLYNEHLLAFYATIARSVKHWSLKFGLRAEQTNYTGRSITTGERIGRNRWNLFPSVYINQKVGKIHALTLSYARRIERPGFRQLHPFTLITSLNSIQEGNPNLFPYYSNNVQLEYLLKNRYTLTVGYQNVENGIATNVSNAGNIVISKDENISDRNSAFMSLYIPVKLTNWWEINANITFRNTTMDIRTQPAVHRSKLSQYLWVTSKFNLPAACFIEVSGYYNRNNFYGIYDAYNEGRIDIAIKKMFFNNRLTSRIELTDPFHLCKPGYGINTLSFTRNVARSRLDYIRSIGIWLTYSFSSGKKQSNREKIDVGGNDARRRL
jgi:hypothetical protein